MDREATLLFAFGDEDVLDRVDEFLGDLGLIFCGGGTPSPFLIFRTFTQKIHHGLKAPAKIPADLRIIRFKRLLGAAEIQIYSPKPPFGRTVLDDLLQAREETLEGFAHLLLRIGITDRKRAVVSAGTEAGSFIAHRKKEGGLGEPRTGAPSCAP